MFEPSRVELTRIGLSLHLLVPPLFRREDEGLCGLLPQVATIVVAIAMVLVQPDHRVDGGAIEEEVAEVGVDIPIRGGYGEGEGLDDGKWV